MTLYSGKQGKCFHQIHWTLNATTKECKTKTRWDTIQGNKASDFTKTHWTLNATTKECKTKTRWDTTFN